MKIVFGSLSYQFGQLSPILFQALSVKFSLLKLLFSNSAGIARFFNLNKPFLQIFNRSRNNRIHSLTLLWYEARSRDTAVKKLTSFSVERRIKNILSTKVIFSCSLHLMKYNLHMVLNNCHMIQRTIQRYCWVQAMGILG